MKFQVKIQKLEKDLMLFLFSKKMMKQDPRKYKPMCLTVVPGKLLEQIIRQHVFEHLDRNSLINRSQHGFMPNKGCQINLISFNDRVTRLVDLRKDINKIYL